MTVDAAKCDGCRACVDACPFGVPDFDRGRRPAALRSLRGSAGRREETHMRGFLSYPGIEVGSSGLTSARAGGAAA